METKPTAIGEIVAANIKREMDAKGLNKNALGIKAAIPSTSFVRMLDHRPEQFTLAHVGDIAGALEIPVIDLMTPRDAA